MQPAGAPPGAGPPLREQPPPLDPNRSGRACTSYVLLHRFPFSAWLAENRMQKGSRTHITIQLDVSLFSCGLWPIFLW